MRILKNLSVTKRLIILSGVSLVALAGYAKLSTDTLDTVKVGGPEYHAISENNAMLADVLPPPEYLVETFLEANRMVVLSESGDLAGANQAGAHVADLKQQYLDRHTYWDAHLADAKTRTLLLSDSYAPAMQVFTAIENSLIPAVKSGDAAAARAALVGPVTTAYTAHRAAVDQIVQRTTAIATSVEQESIRTADSRRSQLIVILLATLALTSILSWAVAHSIIRPIRRVVGVLGVVGQGDLSPRLDMDSNDELGVMSRALDTALTNLSAAMGEIEDQAGSLASSSEELTAVSSQLVVNARETSSQAGSVSHSAQMVSENVITVAAGTEQMTAAIQEISRHAADAAGIAVEATEMVDSSDAMMAKLRISSTEIGGVVQVITSIAEQTNLLALNATIEAARAGSSGKGFAVVAHEVKELAAATSQATASIAERVRAIQSDTDEAMDAISGIHRIVARVGETQSSIASAVEQQTAATNEIARNLAGAADGSSQIAGTIDVIARATDHVTESASHTSDTATELSRMASQLTEILGRFRR